MSNQIEILMLIEAMEMAGFKVMSGNTDGVTVLYPENRRDEFLQIGRDWEQKVGNVEMGKLEETEFAQVWQESVNHYIAKKIDRDNNGNFLKYSVKKKGRFATEYLLNKNKSGRIIALATEAYLIDNKDPIEFIKSHKNIHDFCIARKAAGKLHYEEEWKEGDVIKTKVHKKLVRYFISTTGTVLWKRGINNEGDAMNNQCEAPTEIGQPKITYFNKGWKSDNYNIDYNYYIHKTLKRIDKIEKTKKAKVFAERVNGTIQTSLF